MRKCGREGHGTCRLTRRLCSMRMPRPFVVGLVRPCRGEGGRVRGRGALVSLLLPCARSGAPLLHAPPRSTLFLLHAPPRSTLALRAAPCCTVRHAPCPYHGPRSVLSYSHTATPSMFPRCMLCAACSSSLQVPPRSTLARMLRAPCSALSCSRTLMLRAPTLCPMLSIVIAPCSFSMPICSILSPLPYRYVRRCSRHRSAASALERRPSRRGCATMSVHRVHALNARASADRTGRMAGRGAAGKGRGRLRRRGGTRSVRGRDRLLQRGAYKRAVERQREREAGRGRGNVQGLTRSRPFPTTLSFPPPSHPPAPVPCVRAAGRGVWPDHCDARDARRRPPRARRDRLCGPGEGTHHALRKCPLSAHRSAET